MKLSDEMLMAYADGEADEATRRAVEEEMRRDPAVVERIAQHRALRAQLGGAFESVLHEPIPAHLLDAAQRSPARTNVADLSAARAAQQAPEHKKPEQKAPERKDGRRTLLRRWSWPEWGAIAASLVLGVFAGRVLQAPEPALVASRGGELVAGSRLAAALQHQLGQADASESGLAVVASVRTQSGAYCRAFTAPGNELAGLACLEGEDWRLHTLTTTSPAALQSGYRMAGAELPPALIQAIDALQAGDALNPEQEAAARERGWRD